MHPQFVVRLLAGAMLSLTLCAPGIAQPPDGDLKYVRARTFEMPFHLPASDRDRVASLKLYVAAPNSRDWQLHATATPAQAQAVAGRNLLQGKFDVRLEREGAYDFAIMTVFTDGTSIPANVDQLRNDQRVVVDTRGPAINLRGTTPKQRADGKVEVGVEWDITDDQLDANTIRLDGRWMGGSPAWLNVAQGGPPQVRDQRSWTLGVGRRMEIRLSAMDRAGNRSEKFLLLGPGTGQTTGTSLEPGLPPREGAVGSDTPPGYKIVNDRTLKLHVKVREKPVSGIAAVELWMTRSGNDWKRVEAQLSPPAEGSETSEITHQVTQDGTYGFTMVARSGANVPQAAPVGNQPPQVWVVVDTLPPEAQLLSVKFAHPNDPRSIVLSWKAKDEHLEAQPVIFEYAEVDSKGNQGKWQELSAPLANIGRHVCAVPQMTNGYQFRVRMHVFDRAGNQTTVEHKDPINVDVTPPHVEITDVKPGKQPNKLDSPGPNKLDLPNP